MNNNFQIRDISADDAPQVAKLSRELGYSVDGDLIAKQLTSICADSNHFAFVAISESEIIGYIHGFLAIRLTTSPFAEIGALVVSENHRSKGIGTMLVRHLEEQMSHCESIRVRCNVKRELAHRFYEKLSFNELKEQKVFERKLNPRQANHPSN